MSKGQGVNFLMNVLCAPYCTCPFEESKLQLLRNVGCILYILGDDYWSSDSIPLLLRYRWASGALQPQEVILDKSTNTKRWVNSDSSCVLGCGIFRWEENVFRHFATIASLRCSVRVVLMGFCCAEVFGQ